MGLAAGAVYAASGLMAVAYARDVVDPSAMLPMPGDAAARACLGFGPADIARTPAMGLIARLVGLFGVTVALVGLVAARRRHRLVAQVVGLGALAWSATVAAHLELFQACPDGDAVVQQAVLPWVALGCVNGLGLLGVGLGRKAKAKSKRA